LAYYSKNYKLLIFGEEFLLSDGVSFAMESPLNLFYSELARYFDEVVVTGPTMQVSDLRKNNNYRSNLDYHIRPFYNTSIKSTNYGASSLNLYYHSRPFYNSPIEFFLKFPKIVLPTLRSINEVIARCDVVFLRLPSLLGIYVYVLSRKKGKKLVVHVKGEWSDSVKYGELLTGPAKMAAQVMVKFQDMLSEFIIKRSPVFVHGEKNYNKYSTLAPICHKILVSSINNNDITLGRSRFFRPIVKKILCVARLYPSKGIPYLIHAMTQLPPEINLDIVGYGPSLRKLVNLIKKLKLSSRVHLRGYIQYGPALIQKYLQSDVFVLPSITEGFPKVILEAMAFGLPVVCSGVGAIPEIIHHGHNGLLVKPKSVEDLVDAIWTLIKSPKLRRRIVESGYKTAEAYTVERQAQIVANQIHQVINE